MEQHPHHCSLIFKLYSEALVFLLLSFKGSPSLTCLLLMLFLLPEIQIPSPVLTLSKPFRLSSLIAGSLPSFQGLFPRPSLVRCLCLVLSQYLKVYLVSFYYSFCWYLSIPFRPMSFSQNFCHERCSVLICPQMASVLSECVQED